VSLADIIVHQSEIGWCGLQMVVNKPCQYFFSYIHWF